MPVSMRTSDLRSVVEPLVNEIFDGVYDLRKDEWKQIFKEEPGRPYKYHEEPVLYGFGAAPEMPEGTPVQYQSGGELFTKRYIPRVYGLAFALTQVLVEDGEHLNVAASYAKHLANALIETKETLAANVINRYATSGYNGGDGVPLGSASHPIFGGVASNLSTTAVLSQTSLEQMLIDIRTNAVDNNGKKIRISPQKLLVPPALEFQAEVLLNSTLRAGTANNDINPVKSKSMLSGGVAVLSRLTSSVNWFIKNDAQNGLKLITRRRLTKSMEGDFESDSMRYKATERYDVGHTDWRDLWCNSGT